jgi:hypothetical protein
MFLCKTLWQMTIQYVQMFLCKTMWRMRAGGVVTARWEQRPATQPGRFTPRIIAHVTLYLADERAPEPKQTLCRAVTYLAPAEHRKRTVQSIASLIKWASGGIFKGVQVQNRHWTFWCLKVRPLRTADSNHPVTWGYRRSEKSADANFYLLIWLFFFNFQAATCTIGNGALCWGWVTGM